MVDEDQWRARIVVRSCNYWWLLEIEREKEREMTVEKSKGQ